MTTKIRVIAAILTLLIIFPLAAGCRKNGGDSETTGEDGAGLKDPATNVTAEAVVLRDDLPSLTVDVGERGHDILHGSAGFLYGISNEGVPDVNTLTPLKPKVLATKGALGTEHPYGDALDVAREFFLAGGRQVQMYCSNYYGVFGVTANANDYGAVLRDIIAPAVAEWKDGMRAEFADIDDRIVYIPINEGTPVNGVSGFNAAWKIYYDAIKSSDPGAVIAGPNDAVYRGRDSMTDFFKFCRDNDCLPDIVTWHELQVSCLDTMDDHIADYRRICDVLNIEEAQVVINEYADFADCGVPGRLVNWISRLEDNEVYGCLPFWHQANNLNDLAANANQGNGAWWVYKWYGDMSGQTLSVSAKNTTPEGFYGVASVDANKNCATLLCGGADGDTVIRLSGLDGSDVFDGAERVRVVVEATYFTGYHGALYAPETVLDGVFAVKDGEVAFGLSDNKFSTAYKVTVTPTNEEERPAVSGRYRAVYEAEDASFTGELIVDDQESPIESPKYYCSGGKRVGGIDREGDGIGYLINVPYDGLYRLDFIYGNGVGSTRNNAATHKPLNITQSLFIDGEESELFLPNTLFYSMEGIADKYVSLKAGFHTVSIAYSGDEGGFHDALYVTYAGAYGADKPDFNRVYEAEGADFIAGVSASVKTDREGSSGTGYVSGLEKSGDGLGGIRFIVDVLESGYYDLSFRYGADKDGKLRVFVDNTNLTASDPAASVELKKQDGWGDVGVTLFLRCGINIIDINADEQIALDHMRVIKSGRQPSVTIEAEDAQGKFETAKSGNITYVTEMRANDGYLEFKVNAEEAGDYRVQVFQSNNDLCGTHSYNIKIIDRYAVFTVNGKDARRFFFPNSFSDDTFLERTVTLTLDKGENTIRVYNDDSWQVLWGGSQSTPGTNRLVNYTPNFDKFIFSPVSLGTAGEISDQITYPISVSYTGSGYAYSDKNDAARGERVTLYLLPDGVISRVIVNGEDIKDKFTTKDGALYSASIEVDGDVTVLAEFLPALAGKFDPPAQNVSSGTVIVGTESYELIGENLFKNGDFSDNSGAGMDHWYVGTNKNGHPVNGAYMRPKINPDGTLENLVPLGESGLLIKNAYEPQANGNKFYFGTDNGQPEGMKHYLVEAIGEPWTSNAWNGAASLLAFIPIKPDTNYYFTFRAYTAGGAASVRFGSIRMDSFVKDTYSASDSLDFSGSGYMSCTNGDVQNVGGAWRRYEAIINSGDGDYFLFNAYWLQMASYLCLGDFRLIEAGDEPLTRVAGAERLPTVTAAGGGALTLPSEINVVMADGTRTTLAVEWLNDSAVDTSSSGVYSVTGKVVLPEGYYSTEPLLVTQRVIVR